METEIFITGEHTPQPFQALGLMFSPGQVPWAWATVLVWIGIIAMVIWAAIESQSNGDPDKQNSFNLAVVLAIFLIIAQLFLMLVLFTRYTSISYLDLHTKFMPV